MKNIALMLAGIIFTLVSVLQFVRYFKAWEVMVAQHNIPVEWSLYAGVFAGVVALIMFVAMNR